VNGQEKKWDLGLSNFKNIKYEILQINDYVEYERCLGGQDDELEDEA
jgi:hypothetical protein